MPELGLLGLFKEGDDKEGGGTWRGGSGGKVTLGSKGWGTFIGVAGALVIGIKSRLRGELAVGE